MTGKNIRVGMAALGVLFAAAGTAEAQQMGMGGGEEHGMMGNMNRIHVFQPGTLLEHGEMLMLSDGQRARLEEIREASMQAHHQAKQQHDRHMMQMAALFTSGSVDEDEANAHFGAAHEAGGRAHWAMISAAVQAMEVLNDEQRARAHGWADARTMMRHHRGEMMRDRMMDDDDDDEMMGHDDDEMMDDDM